MPKRTQEDILKEEVSDIDVSSSEDEELCEDEEPELIDVDFDFFNINPKIDHEGTKCFIRQIFQQDSELISFSQLTDVLLSKNEVGSAVKTDGPNGDVFSIITVTGLTDGPNNPILKKLSNYLIQKTENDGKFNSVLHQLLVPGSKHLLGLLFSERMINMPVETVPPMYNMLIKEMEKADYKYDYFLIPSRVYKIVDSEVDKELKREEDGSEPALKKRSKKGTNGMSELDYYHDEDVILEKYALHHGYYEYTNKGINPDARRVFNDYAIVPKLSLILIDKNSLEKAIEEMNSKFSAA